MAEELMTPVRQGGVMPLSPSLRSPGTNTVSPRRAVGSATASPRKGMSHAASGETPGSAACAAFEAVANALERDLEDEKRERKEQVGFLNKSYSQEKDLLVHRSEAFERQLMEARGLWQDERALLLNRLQSAEAASVGGERVLRQATDAAAQRASQEEAEKFAAALEQAQKASETRLEAERLQIEARSAKWSGSYEAIISKNACLEVELEAERRGSTAAMEAVERSAAARLISVEAERDKAAAAQADRVELESTALQRAREEASRHARTSEEEISSLRLEVHRWQAAHNRLEFDSELRLQQGLAEAQAEAKMAAERETVRIRKECEEGGREAMVRAIWQLQSADDCVQNMRQQQSQEASACAAERRRAEEMERRAVEESSQNRQLAASLANAQTEHQELLRRLREVEQELDMECAEHAACREAGRDALANASRERLDTLGLVEQLRMHGRNLDVSRHSAPNLEQGRSLSSSTAFWGAEPAFARSSAPGTARQLQEYLDTAPMGGTSGHVAAAVSGSAAIPTNTPRQLLEYLDTSGVLQAPPGAATGSSAERGSASAPWPMQQLESTFRPGAASGSLAERGAASAPWPMQQLESTLTAAAELERRLWERIESPPRWRQNGTAKSLSASATLDKTRLVGSGEALRESVSGDTWSYRQHA